MSQCVREAEGVTGAAVEIDQPFEGLETAWHAARQFVLHAADDFVLARVDHRDANLSNDGHGAITLTRLQKCFDDFLRGAKIFAIGAQNTQRKSCGLVPISAFEIK